MVLVSREQGFWKLGWSDGLEAAQAGKENLNLRYGGCGGS